MTKRYSLEVQTGDADLLIDLPGEASFTMKSRKGGNDVFVSVLETLDEALVAEWRRILDDSDRAYVFRVLEANDIVSEQSLRSPTWRSA